MTFRDYFDRGRIDSAAYRDSYETGYMYGHGMVAGLAASLYYAALRKVQLHVLHLGVMPVGANELVRHAKFDLGQDVTAELEAASLLMSGDQAIKVAPFAYLWACTSESGWDTLATGVANMLVGEHAPHTVEEVEPVQGMPVHTIVRGESVMLDGRVVGASRYGRFTPGSAASNT